MSAEMMSDTHYSVFVCQHMWTGSLIITAHLHKRLQAGCHVYVSFVVNLQPFRSRISSSETSEWLMGLAENLMVPVLSYWSLSFTVLGRPVGLTALSPPVHWPCSVAASASGCYLTTVEHKGLPARLLLAMILALGICAKLGYKMKEEIIQHDSHINFLSKITQFSETVFGPSANTLGKHCNNPGEVHADDLAL